MEPLFGAAARVVFGVFADTESDFWSGHSNFVRFVGELNRRRGDADAGLKARQPRLKSGPALTQVAQAKSIDRGFTLVELVVVLLLIGILAFFVLPRTSQNTLELSSQAEQVATDIRYAQTLSMTRGAALGSQGRYCIFFTATGYQYRNNGNSYATPCTVAVNHPATGSSAAIVLAGSVTTQA